MSQSLESQGVGHDLATKQQQLKDAQTESSLHALQLETDRQKNFFCSFQSLHHVICHTIITDHKEKGTHK